MLKCYRVMFLINVGLKKFKYIQHYLPNMKMGFIKYELYFLSYPSVDCIKQNILNSILSNLEKEENMCAKRELHLLRSEVSDYMTKLFKETHIEQSGFTPLKMNGLHISEIHIKQN